jgi:hypothetical protein
LQTQIELRKTQERIVRQIPPLKVRQVTHPVKPEDRVFVYSDSEIVVHYSANKRKFESIKPRDKTP